MDPITFGPEREEQEVTIPVGAVRLDGTMGMPPEPIGVVVFAHGSGSGRFSPRNRYVAQYLRNAGMGTLLFDLLTPSEAAQDQLTGRLRFNIDLLADRLEAVVAWLSRQDVVKGMDIGLFGASTGAAAAIVAAAHRPGLVKAVVSRGGRPDLAGAALTRILAPTLMIVGGDDVPVIGLNRQAIARMRAPVQLEVVPGATHLFEEPGTLDIVAGLAADWFHRHLRRKALRPQA